MPLARYFLFVGGVLLALLFIADAYLPKLPIAEVADPHLPVIHIYSAESLPERVVIDTSIATMLPAPPINPIESRQAPADLARLREAFARLPPPDDLAKPQSTETEKQRPTPQRHGKSARRHAPSPMRLVWRQPPFAWGGHRSWW
jgi:hypothetical protein